MIRHIFLDKCNTIIENSELNTGLNPVAEINAGDTITRVLTHFDINEVKNDIIESGIDINNIKCTLKLTNCGSVGLPIFNNKVNMNGVEKERAASFDIIAFKIPFNWDEGRGFDYYDDITGDKNIVNSKDGSNWFQSSNGLDWDEHGVFFNKTLKEDYYNNFGLNDNGIIVSRQHFDSGCENFEIDVTKYVNDVLLGKCKNYGIGLAFSPRYEIETTENRFISFFTNHTNTPFLPYLEIEYNDEILDNRANFHLGVKNRLYFFVSDNGEYINLDKLPTCSINDIFYEVKQLRKGVYYIDILLSQKDFEPETILIDTWSDIYFNGEKLDDIEMEFVTLPLNKKISFGNNKKDKISLYPQLSGVKNKEKLKIGDIREIEVDFIEEYSYGKKHIPNISEYRIYIKNGAREVDIFPYQTIDRKFDEHTFVINTNDLVPNIYYVDVKLKNNNETKIFENVLEFEVVSNLTNFFK